jgi:aspartate 1-decarboxylase
MLSCTGRWEENLANDDTLNTTISVVLPQLPEAQSDTRAITNVQELKTLHLAVFDESGQLTQYLATENLTKVNGDEGNIYYTYKVNGLKPSDSHRIIHFIGNGPQDVTYGDEVAVIANLYTAEDEQYADAYRQRVVLEDGIANDDATKTALSGVQLIRNFAWIELKTSTDCNFTIFPLFKFFLAFIRFKKFYNIRQ